MPVSIPSSTGYATMDDPTRRFKPVVGGDGDDRRQRDGDEVAEEYRLELVVDALAERDGDTVVVEAALKPVGDRVVVLEEVVCEEKHHEQVREHAEDERRDGRDLP